MFLVLNESRLIESYKGQPETLLIDCVDPLGRSALTVAIENENFELIQLLLEEGVKVKVIIAKMFGNTLLND